MAGIAALGWALARPAPRLSPPLPLTAEIGAVIDVDDMRGRAVMRDVRAVEDGRFYTGSALATGTDVDQTAFEFLRQRNVRLVVSLQPDDIGYHAEDGYLRYWGDQTGYRMATLWLQVPPDRTYALSDRSALHAAAELISRMKRDWPLTAAVYVHGGEDRDAALVVVAAYELWRNRGWQHPEALWSAVEARFLLRLRSSESPAGSGGEGAVTGSRLQAFRALRRRMEYLGEL